MAYQDYRYGVELGSDPGKFNITEYDECVTGVTYQRVHSGPYVAMSARQANGSIGRFAAYDRSGPGRTLLWEDDFADLSQWSVGNDGHHWSASGGKARISSSSGTSEVLYRPMNGARYFEMEDIDFNDTDGGDRWFMITLNRVNGGRRTDDPAVNGPGDDGYRVLVRQHPDDRSSFTPGVTEKSVQSVNAISYHECVTVSGGWRIGQIGIGNGPGIA